MKLNIIKALSTDNVVIVTDDIAKTKTIKDWTFVPVAEFGETEPARIKWISDTSLNTVKDFIEQQGYARLVDGVPVAGLPEAFGFFPERSLGILSAYWGSMVKIGALGNAVSAYRVRFHDNIPHRYHSHPNHAELLFIVSGAIDQTIGYETRRMAAGDVVVIPRGARHQAIPREPGTEVIVILFGEGGDYEVKTTEE